MIKHLRLGRFKAYMQRADSYMVYPMRLFFVLGFMSLSGWDMMWSFPIAVAGILIYLTTGFIDAKFGLWRAENEFLNKRVMPPIEEILTKLDQIDERLDGFDGKE